MLRIPEILFNQMLDHALGELPNECCGLLAGRSNGELAEVEACYPLVNAMASATEFLSEPQSMFAAVKEMRARGIDVLAVYHSHPTSEPVPSKRDLERNYSPNVVSLIIGLATGKPDVRGWWLTDTSFTPAQFELR